MQGRGQLWRGPGRWLIVALAIYGFVAGPSLYGEYLWFAALGYEQVFLTIFGYRVALFLLTATVSVTVLYSSYRVAMANLRSIEADAPPWTYQAGIVTVAVFIGLIYASSWDTVLRFLHATPFEVADPVFGRDVAFYVYTLPMLNLVIGFLMLVVSAGLVLSLVLYARSFVATAGEREPNTVGSIDLSAYLSYLRERAYVHLVTYLGALLILQGAAFFINRYELLFSPPRGGLRDGRHRSDDIPAVARTARRYRRARWSGSPRQRVAAGCPCRVYSHCGDRGVPTGWERGRVRLSELRR